MISLLMIAAAFIGAACVAAYVLATFALPVMIAMTAARFACASGAGLVGFLAGVMSFGLLAHLFVTLRSPILRLAVALMFAIPAAIAGYALVHGLTRDGVSSEFWRQVFCIAGGTCTGLSALARLVKYPSSGGA